jgi:hypothetical protein
MIAEFFIQRRKGTVGSVNNIVKLSQTKEVGINEVDCKLWLELNEASTTRYSGKIAKIVPKIPTK